MSEWIYLTKHTNNGGMFPNQIPLVQSAYAIDAKNLLTLFQALGSPTLWDSLTRFFKDINSTLTAIYLFPFRLPTTGDKVALKILDVEIEHVGNTVGVYNIDASHYLSQHVVLGRTLISPMDGTEYFYDFNGFTKVCVYLPFYGEVEIPTNDVMGKYLQVTYAISAISGDIMYFIGVANTADGDARLLAKYSTKIAVEIPIGVTNAHEVNRNIIMASANAISTVASAGASVSLTAAGVGASVSKTVYDKHSVTKKRRLTKDSRLKTVGQSDLTGSVERTSTTPVARDILSATESFANSSLNALNNSVIHASSEVTKDAVLEQFASQSVKVIIYRPKLVRTFYDEFVGRPYGEVRKIGDLQGFTKMANVHLSNFTSPITNSELHEIESILTSGFILK